MAPRESTPTHPADSPPSNPPFKHPPFAQVVLLRGLAREAGHWGPFVEGLTSMLRDHFGGRPLRCVDLPGAGKRHREVCPSHLHAIADAVAPDVARPAPALVIALSLGGMVGLELLQRPELNLAGLVAVNTSAGQINTLLDRLSPIGLGLLVASLAAPSLRLRESWIHRFTSNRPETRAETVLRWMALAQHQPVARANVLRQVWAASRFVPAACRPSKPLLWLASSGDRMVSVRCSQELHRRLGGEMQIHRDAGHDLAHDDPQWFLLAIREWMTRNFAAPGEA